GLLRKKGFGQATADTVGATREKRTVLRYPSADLEGDALRVAEVLGIPSSAVKRSTEVSGVTLVVGADWREGDAYRAPEEDDSTPDSAQPLNGADDSASMQGDPAFSWWPGHGTGPARHDAGPPGGKAPVVSVRRTPGRPRGRRGGARR